MPILETEIFSYGLMPLALSARCFTARANNLPKDQCDLRCIEYPDGMPVNSQEEQSLFTLNGIQTLSGLPYDLYNELEDMQTLGVDIARISPASCGTMKIVDAYQKKLHGPYAPDNHTSENCNGYWYGEPGMLHNFKKP